MDSQSRPDSTDPTSNGEQTPPEPTKSPEPAHKAKKIHVARWVILLIVLVVAGFVLHKLWEGSSLFSSLRADMLPTKDAAGNTVSYNRIEALALSNGDCKSAGSVSLIPPMQLSQVGFILPYGLVEGGHVTSVDHQYYNGLNTSALRDAYNVVAPATGVIVNIQHRGSNVNTPSGTVDIPSSDEYRIVISYTCSFYSYVDLVTSLDPNVKSKLPAGTKFSQGSDVNVHIPVTQGEIIGHIGGQTLDFAVWDLSKQLPGFVNTSDYTAENWKPYTAPPSNYFEPSIKAATIAKYVRTAAPIDGKIDNDIDGKLVGNWFLQGSGGYHANSNKAQNYWVGHLSIAPDYLDPSVDVASIGDYGSYAGAHTDSSGAIQLVMLPGGTDPTTVGASTGLVKYQLIQRAYVSGNGQPWLDGFATGIRVLTTGNPQIIATALAEVTATRTLKFEVFPGKTAVQVTAFDASAKTYTR